MRTNQLPQESFATDIKKTLRDLETIKLAQKIGNDSLVLYLSYIANHVDAGWDIAGVSVGIYDQKIFTFIFAPTHLEPVYAEFSHNETYTPATGFEIIEVYPDPDNQNLSDGRTAWKLIFNGDSNALTLSMDVAVKSTDTGVITWSVV